MTSKNNQTKRGNPDGIFFSQRVLLELTSVGFTREQSYKIVQRNAMQASHNTGVGASGRDGVDTD